jgi:hypothetical protein
MRAADPVERGVIPAEIARQVGVSHQIVLDWRAAWRQAGKPESLNAHDARRTLRGLELGPSICAFRAYGDPRPDYAMRRWPRGFLAALDNRQTARSAADKGRLMWYPCASSQPSSAKRSQLA